MNHESAEILSCSCGATGLHQPDGRCGTVVTATGNGVVLELVLCHLAQGANLGAPIHNIIIQASASSTPLNSQLIGSGRRGTQERYGICACQPTALCTVSSLLFHPAEVTGAHVPSSALIPMPGSMTVGMCSLLNTSSRQRA